MWIGESERNLSLIFEQARSRTPCVLFFDELDALAYSRSKSSSSSARTVVNEFLAQLDGFNDNNECVRGELVVMLGLVFEIVLGNVAAMCSC
jgi:SpoVK/Ycf46/Vps4 family AAA+-type ATPase